MSNSAGITDMINGINPISAIRQQQQQQHFTDFKMLFVPFRDLRLFFAGFYNQVLSAQKTSEIANKYLHCNIKFIWDTTDPIFPLQHNRCYQVKFT
jgi:hypothetical protein